MSLLNNEMNDLWESKPMKILYFFIGFWTLYSFSQLMGKDESYDLYSLIVLLLLIASLYTRTIVYRISKFKQDINLEDLKNKYTSDMQILGITLAVVMAVRGIVDIANVYTVFVTLLVFALTFALIILSVTGGKK